LPAFVLEAAEARLNYFYQNILLFKTLNTYPYLPPLLFRDLDVLVVFLFGDTGIDIEKERKKVSSKITTM